MPEGLRNGCVVVGFTACRARDLRQFLTTVGKHLIEQAIPEDHGAATGNVSAGDRLGDDKAALYRPQL